MAAKSSSREARFRVSICVSRGFLSRVSHDGLSKKGSTGSLKTARFTEVGVLTGLFAEL